ncbi:MAG: class I SAM-dependent methyltransferase, partial [Pseudomonadota bacterium]
LIELRLADAVEMNLDRQFDAIYCVETFFHIPGHLQLLAFQNFHRHLKPGGSLMVQFAIQDRIQIRFLAYALFYHVVYRMASPILRVAGRESFYTNVTRVSRDEVEDIADRSGFELCKVNPNGYCRFQRV